MFGMLSAIEIACIVHDLFLFRFDGAQKFGSHLSRSHAFGGKFVQANPAGVLKGRSDRKENGGKSEQQVGERHGLIRPVPLPPAADQEGDCGGRAHVDPEEREMVE